MNITIPSFVKKNINAADLILEINVLWWGDVREDLIYDMIIDEYDQFKDVEIQMSTIHNNSFFIMVSDINPELVKGFIGLIKNKFNVVIENVWE